MKETSDLLIIISLSNLEFILIRPISTSPMSLVIIGGYSFWPFWLVLPLFVCVLERRRRCAREVCEFGVVHCIMFHVDAWWVKSHIHPPIWPATRQYPPPKNPNPMHSHHWMKKPIPQCPGISHKQSNPHLSLGQQSMNSLWFLFCHDYLMMEFFLTFLKDKSMVRSWSISTYELPRSK